VRCVRGSGETSSREVQGPSGADADTRGLTRSVAADQDQPSRELRAWQVEIAPGTVGQEHVVSREEARATTSVALAA